MKSTDFTPKIDIDEYLCDFENVALHEELKTLKQKANKIDGVELLEPLEFFNLLYESVAFVKVNIQKPSFVMNHLTKLDLCLRERFLFLDALAEHFRKEIEGNCTCLYFIEQEVLNLRIEINRIEEYEKGNIIKITKLNKSKWMPDIPTIGKTIPNTIETLESLPDTTTKKRYLIEKIAEHKQLHVGLPDNVTIDDQFFEWAEIEIKKYDDLLELERIQPGAGKTSGLANFSSAQLVLIFYFYLKYSGIELRRDTDLAPVAKFMHLIMGREFKSTASSSFYDKLRMDTPGHNTGASLIKDLEAIIPLFEKVQLKDIVTMIKNRIEEEHLTIKNDNRRR